MDHTGEVLESFGRRERYSVDRFASTIRLVFGQSIFQGWLRAQSSRLSLPNALLGRLKDERIENAATFINDRV